MSVQGIPAAWDGARYGVMPWVVVADRELNDGDRATLMQIARYVQVYNDAYPTQQTLARLCRVGVSTIARRVRRLCCRGLLKATPEADGRIHYDLLPLTSVYSADEIAATAHMPRLDALRATHPGTRRPWSAEAIARSSARKAARRAARNPPLSEERHIDGERVRASCLPPISGDGVPPSPGMGGGSSGDGETPSPVMAKGNNTGNKSGNSTGNDLRDERAGAALTPGGSACSRASISNADREQNSAPITGAGGNVEVYITCDSRHSDGWRDVVTTLVNGSKIHVDDDGVFAIGDDVTASTPRTHADAERMARTITKAGRERGLAMTALTLVYTWAGQEVSCRLVPRQAAARQNAG